MIDLAALEQALAPIAELGREPYPLTVGGVDLVLNPLSPDAERAVQGWARAVLQDEKGRERENPDHVEVLEYLDRFKVGVLSYAVSRIGNLDLTGVKYIKTGESEDGKPIREETHMVLRRMLEARFTRPLLLYIFKAYGDLMTRVELETEQAVVYDPVDLQAEIDRVKERLLELEALQKNQGAAAEDSVSRQMGAVLRQTELVQQGNRDLARESQRTPAPVIEPEQIEPAPQAAPVKEPEPSAPPPRREGRSSAIPSSVPAPSRVQEEPQRPPPPQPPRPRAPEIMDSFADPSADALAMENQRLLVARKKARTQRETTVKSGRPRRQPPHRAAANRENAVVDSGGHQLRRATPMGTVEGREAYRLPTTEISDRGGESSGQIDPSKAKFNDEGGEVNTRFQPPRRR